MLQATRVAHAGGWLCLGVGGVFLVLALAQAAALYAGRHVWFLLAAPSSYAIHVRWLPPSPSELMQVAAVFAIFAIALFLASERGTRSEPVRGS